MGWIDRFHSHRLAANLLMVMMLALGLFAARQVPTALDPSATIPGVWVEVQWPGAAAEDVAEAVATPLDMALWKRGNTVRSEPRSRRTSGPSARP